MPSMFAAKPWDIVEAKFMVTVSVVESTMVSVITRVNPSISLPEVATKLVWRKSGSCGEDGERRSSCLLFVVFLAGS